MNAQLSARRVAGFRPGGIALMCSVLALAGGITVQASTPAAATPAGFKVYTNASGGYRVDYPAPWHAAGATLVTVFRGPMIQGIPTSVYITPVGSASIFRSVDVLATLMLQRYLKRGVPTAITKTRVAGVDARTFSGASRSNSQPERDTIGVFIGRGKAWTITFSVAVDAYAKWAGAFHTMLTSFAFAH